MRCTSYGKLWPNQKKLASSLQAATAASAVLRKPAPNKVEGAKPVATPWLHCRRTKDEDQAGKNGGQKNAVQASHPDRIHTWFPAPPDLRMTASARSAPQECRIAKASCGLVILRSRTCNRCGGQRSCPCSEEQGGGGGRNTRATSRACARFLDDPPAIHPRESPASAGSAAIIRQAQELSRFAEPTLSQLAAPRNTKKLRPCAEAVEDETSLWKTVENQERISLDLIRLPALSIT
jgi:hypothetical protein